MHKGDVGGMWDEKGLRSCSFFSLFSFWCGTLTIKHGEGVLTMVLWRGVCVCVYIPDVRKKKARKKEKKRKEKKDNPSSAWFNSMVLYFIKI